MNAPRKTGAKKTMAFGKVGEVMLLVHNKVAPGDEEWNAWVEYAFRHFSPGSMLKCLIVTEGGAPTPTQRLSMNERLSEYLIDNPKALRNAIVTASAFVRGVVTALSWFHPGYCAFSPAHLDDAMQYLDVPDESRTEVRTLIKALQGQIPPDPDKK
jgi:hypothetical protein